MTVQLFSLFPCIVRKHCTSSICFYLVILYFLFTYYYYYNSLIFIISIISYFLGVGLTDSPAGIAGYILEKFSHSVTVKWPGDPNDEVSTDIFAGKFATDDLLDNIMFYWITSSITSSFRLYAEAFTPKFRSLHLDR